MHLALWTAQGLLAALYLMAGILKAFQTPKVRESMPWAKDRSDAFIKFVGWTELAGAWAMIFPTTLGFLPILTPLAAIGLGIIQLLAIFMIHIPRKEYRTLPMNISLLLVSIFVVLGRFNVFHP